MLYRFIVVIIIASALLGCSPKVSDIVVSEFKGGKITLGEFEKAYSKNAGSIENAKDDSLSQMKKFLELYTNFRMKLDDAKQKGYDNNQSLIDELSAYKKKVGSSYLLEKEIVEPGLKKFYDDRKTEIRMSHIMFGPVDDSFEKAKEKADKVAQLLKEGVAFSELARQYSDDNYTKNDGGDIYWITAGQVIPEFERVAYSTPVGTVYPEIMKTNFGYHLIAVTDKQPAKYKIRASHILISFNQDGAVDTVKAKEKITEIKNRINKGEDFAELAKQLSDDKNSGVNGGDLGFFSRRMMVKEFDQAAFNLKVGEVSDIVKTKYGYHILKVTDTQDFPPFEKEKEKLRELYKKSRYDFEYNNYLTKLKQELNYKFNSSVIDLLTSSPDTIRFDEKSKNNKLFTENKNKTVFSIDGVDYNLDSIFTYANTEKKFQGKVINHNNNLTDASNLFADQKLLEHKAMILDKTNPEFSDLMEDYKKGIYIFKLQEEEIWSKVKVDTVEMKKVYEENKGKYTLPDRVDFSEILVKDDSLALQLYNSLKSGAGFDSLAKSNTRRAGFRNKSGRHGMINVGDNELAKKAFDLKSKGDFSEPFKNRDGWSIVKLNSKDFARIKTFDEAKAEIASELQEQQSRKLEDEYIQRLKNNYQPVYYFDNLNNAFKSN
jgi:peptidyl-prolyl cis-trans isomerase SurA